MSGTYQEGAAMKAANRIAKWRSLFTGWQLGTRSQEDPEAQAVRDHREGTLLARIELNAITQLLVEKGVFTKQEFEAQLVVECNEMEIALERRFPGARATSNGLELDQRIVETMKGWRP